MSYRRVACDARSVNQIELRSDNAAGVAPEIMAALTAADAGSALAYGADARTAELEAVVREVFEHPTARVFPVSSGTAANALALAAMSPPWGAVLCHETAHIIVNECGATSMFGAGAVMRGVAGDGYLVGATELRAALEAAWWGAPHQSQPSVLSLTQPSDMGTIYTVEQVAELAAIAGERDMRVHLDGARIANSLVALGCSPAELTWRAGVDVMTLGATKNGAMSTDAIVTFDDAVADELVYRTKRSGHVTSKMRYQSAQLITYLTDDLWRTLAANANAQMTALASGLADLGVELLNQPDVNMLFVRVGDAVADALEAAGLLFYRMGGGVIRFVTSWQTTEAEVAATLAAIAAAIDH